MLDQNITDMCIAQFSLMKFFPRTDPEFRAALIMELNDICRTEDEMVWLTKRIKKLYTEWPDARELRAVYASKHSTFADGESTEAYFSSVYLDGIPSKKQAATAPLLIDGKVPTPEEIEANKDFARELLADAMESTELPDRRRGDFTRKQIAAHGAHDFEVIEGAAKKELQS